MRKALKIQALEMIQTLADAHKAIAGCLDRGMPASTLALLSECQQCAIHLGEFIEDSEGEDNPAVRELEDYCETVYQTSQGISCTVRPKGMLERLEQSLLNVKKCIEQDISVQIEIVFLPYKASMWDSMESIWRAANADPDCNAYVVPIPYYDKNLDGSLGLRHYEGDLYPQDVPVKYYSEYDLEKHRPDVVFIHNPYDECNHVTTVDPAYYSSKVKSWTDCLVYVDYGVPYWVPLTPVKPRFFAPAYFSCDLSVFHSREYAEQIRTCISNQVPPELHAEVEKRVVALGSAKFDAVLQATRENQPLPDAWKAQIGTNKKVMLYSTTLKSLLKQNEQFLTRLKRELQFFRRQKDIVLWWRPHPLSEAAISGMRPGLLREYERIVNQYRQEKWGIYDETASLHRAIAWSDGCYTDESSLLFLYLATGKPFACRSFFRFKHQVSEPSEDFGPIIDKQISNMQAARGANILHKNTTIWWHCFADRDIGGGIQYNNFLARFLHFLLHEEQYPQAELYRQLKRQMFHEFVVNPDGTAGKKIYEYVKQKAWG